MSGLPIHGKALVAASTIKAATPLQLIVIALAKASSPLIPAWPILLHELWTIVIFTPLPKVAFQKDPCRWRPTHQSGKLVRQLLQLLEMEMVDGLAQHGHQVLGGLPIGLAIHGRALAALVGIRIMVGYDD